MSAATLDPTQVRFAVADGLVPAVVQDANSGRVLMVAYMDAEALVATLRSGEVYFHSRSRRALWRKGETSGNVLRLRDVALDCDGDALLVSVEPSGPTCHRGTRSCFDPVDAELVQAGSRIDAAPPDAGQRIEAGPSETGPVEAAPPDDSGAQGFAWLETLWTTIVERATSRPTGSYTSRLLEGGVDAVARKVTEEATEVLLAAKDDATAQAADADRATTRLALAGEAADLVFHALVLLAERGLAPSAVLDLLHERHRA